LSRVARSPTRSHHALIVCSFLVPFFCSAASHHRDLHSFPTRRSSDLVLLACVVARLPGRGARDTGHSGEHRGEQQHGAETPGARDRKSTRLNSSHVKISYAVFCLKKKKKKQPYKLSRQHKHK